VSNQLFEISYGDPMSQQVRMWRVAQEDNLIEVNSRNLDLEDRLENWINANIGIVDAQLLIVGRQVATDYGGYIDLLAIDRRGDLVIMELKRGRTPREVVAQSLDYASWVSELSHERVTQIADAHFGSGAAFEMAFRARFGVELPETMNAAHRIVIVAIEVDPSSERIIQYLSRNYGVDINALTFQYFREQEGAELITRVFLLEPSEVEQQVRRKGSSRRQPNLSTEELYQLATDRDIGDLYSASVSILRPLFDDVRTTRSSLGFVGDFNGKSSVMLNLIPTLDSCEEGLGFQVYSSRVARRFSIGQERLISVLPSNTEVWSYGAEMSSDWSGFQGCFTTVQEVQQVASLFSSARGQRPIT
jgi:hypothetical protein